MSDTRSATDLDELELTGRSGTHVIEVAELGCRLHPAAAAALRALRDAARADGIAIEVASSFRDFDRQRTIWNAKFRGERPLLDRDGLPLAGPPPDADARIDAILLWSAMPGASRHHWGTDFDVIDAAALSPGYRPRLVPEEFAAGGPFARLDAWLGVNMARFGFFRPYGTDRGGVRPEPWHLSFAPLSAAALAALTPGKLRVALESAPLEGRAELLARLDALHQRYVVNVDRPPAAALARDAR